jgi:chemosensory pili system protein ChpC
MTTQFQPRRQAEPEVRGIVAPTTDGILLLPMGAVAEIVTYDGQQVPKPGVPEWLLGELPWRGQKVPLINVASSAKSASFAGDAGQRRRHPSALVCFTPNGNQALPYIALLLADTPRLVRLRSSDLAESAQAPDGLFVLYRLQCLGQPAWVPDFDEIERELMLQGLGQS